MYACQCQAVGGAFEELDEKSVANYQEFGPECSHFAENSASIHRQGHLLMVYSLSNMDDVSIPGYGPCCES